MLAPEDAGWVGFDLLEYLVDAAWREIVVAVPAAIAIGLVQVPFVGAGAVAECATRTLDHSVRFDCNRGRHSKMATEPPRTLASIRTWSRRRAGTRVWQYFAARASARRYMEDQNGMRTISAAVIPLAENLYPPEAFHRGM